MEKFEIPDVNNPESLEDAGKQLDDLKQKNLLDLYLKKVEELNYNLMVSMQRLKNAHNEQKESVYGDDPEGLKNYSVLEGIEQVKSDLEELKQYVEENGMSELKHDSEDKGGAE